MFTKVEWLIAKRYLKTKRKESFITIISWLSLTGITLGVAVLIIVTSVMTGFKKELIKSIVGIDGHLTVTSLNNNFIPNYNSLITAIQKNPAVTNVGASINTQGLVSTKYYSAGAIVKALTLSDIEKRNIKLNYNSKKALEQFKNGDKVVFMGSSLARNMGAIIGEPVKVVFPEFNSTAFGLAPKYVTLILAATFKTGMLQYDNNMVIIPLNIAQLVFASKGVQAVEIFIKNPETTEAIRAELHSSLGDNFFITTWQENNVTLITALNTERNVMFIILFLIVMVATFNIMSGLIMLVRSKTKEIAILKAMGFNSANIQKVFLIIGIRTGVVGTILGVILGVLFSLNIERIREFVQNVLHVNVFNENVYFLSKLPAVVSFTEVAIIAGSALLLTILASIYPSYRAAKIVVAKALHYE